MNADSADNYGLELDFMKNFSFASMNGRLEAACQRALSFDNPRYRSVKTILDKGLDQHRDAAAAFDTLAESYTGGARFLRDASELLSH